MNVFTYGSLMYPDIFSAVTGYSLQCTSAKLAGWRRYALADRTYPGALTSDQHSDFIVGIVWLDVNPKALLALDRFEGDDYERVTVSVTTEEGQSLTSHIYRWRLPALTAGAWDRGEFEKKHRANFVQRHQA
jgi:gamma-glutamylcyclotransferase (GGCT)/AIG2-like uncharacterized protein YtfP